MSGLIVASVQQRVHIPASPESYRRVLERFLRVAQSRHAQLIVFPELGGTMVPLSMLDDVRSGLLKRADVGARRESTFWQRVVGNLSGSLARYLRADTRRSLAGLLDVSAVTVWEAYFELYSSLAREYDMTVVAPSAYLPDPLDGVIRNLAVVFGSDGELLGTQAKVVLHPTDADLAQPGTTWDVIQTEVGRLGLIVGGDVLYPEVGRLLAYQGADVLVAQAACLDMAMYNKMRAGVLARMQDNQLFAVASFLVGRNILAAEMAAAYAGKSAIFAPQELTPKYNGVLVEMGGPNSEGVVAAEWDFEALRELWESSDTPLRRSLTTAELGNAMGEIYARLQRLPAVAERPLIPSERDSDSWHIGGAIATLDDLKVLDSYCPDADVPDADGQVASEVGQQDDERGKSPTSTDPLSPTRIAVDDETDEYDSVS